MQFKRFLAIAAIAVLSATPVVVNGASVSTPYTNTFTTDSSTNDFVQGWSPIQYLQYAQWVRVSPGVHQNQLNSTTPKATMYGWATLDFADLGGTPSEARNFAIEAKMAARCNPTASLYPGGYQGLCALATGENLDAYYYGRIYYTQPDGVGSIVIQKIVANSTTLSSDSVATTIPFLADRQYALKLTGVYTSSSSPVLTLTFSLAYGSETNTVSLTDPAPLQGKRFGYHACNNKSSSRVSWDDLKVESSKVTRPPTRIILY